MEDNQVFDDPLDALFGPSSPSTPPVPVKKKKQSLYAIGSDMSALDNLLDEIDGDLSDPGVDTIIDRWFSELHDNLNEKVDGYCSYIKELEGRSETRDKEAKRLAALATTDKNLAKRLRGRLLDFWQAKKLSKMHTKHFNVNVVANGGTIPLEIDEINFAPEMVPEKYQKVIVTFNKDNIRKALAAGEHLDFAKLGERGYRLNIR